MRRCLEGRAREARGRPERSRSRTLRDGDALSRSALEVHVLYASPLDQRLPQIDIQAELELLTQALRDAGSEVRVRVGVATAFALTQVLTLARAGVRILLHLSAHVVRVPERGPCLVLENKHGGAHVLHRPNLEELLAGDRPLDGLLLVFINSCWSESLAQLLVESGCPHVIATRGQVPDAAARAFAQQFYFALGSQQSLLSAWESAQQLLRVDPNPKLSQCADLFVLFGQRNARSSSFLGGQVGARMDRPGELSSQNSLERSLSSNSVLSSSGGSPAGGLPMVTFDFGAVPDECELPPRVEDFVGRATMMRDLLGRFEASREAGGRRVVVLWGPSGVGKSALAAELAYFSSSPGRLFSKNVMFVPLRVSSRVSKVLAAIANGLRGTMPDAFAHQQFLARLERGEESEAHAIIQRGLVALDRQRGRSLLIIDDEIGALPSSARIRSILGSFLDCAPRLRILVCSRESVYQSIGSCKCVNIELTGLLDSESAQLFLKRIHRPLRPCDLVRNSPEVQNIERSDDLLESLAVHPIMKQLRGNPRLVCAAGEKVTPELRSLFDLRLNNDSVDGGTGSECGSIGTDAGSAVICVASSVDDETSGCALTRAMSIDEAPLTRDMSIDETT